jgi:D-alanine-D-alanine ligase
MRVAILHQAITADAGPDEQDVLVQVDAVSQALRSLDHETRTIACTLNLQSLKGELTTSQPDRVFNLVESLGGTDSLQFVVPAVVESLGLRMTGASSECIFLSGRKTRAKELMRGHGLPTPPWFVGSDYGAEGLFEPGRYIVKPIAEHASLGMVDSDVQPAEDLESLRAAITAKTRSLGRDCFAERFIDGREFNLSLLDGPAGPQVLPIAEIRFVDFPPDKPRIVGHAAKWNEKAFEYHATPRSFDYPTDDNELLDRLQLLSIDCWSAMELAGYARVDFRVDNAGQPWILEVNANPCLSPDAGFAAAAARGGLSFEDVVQRILEAA